MSIRIDEDIEYKDNAATGYDLGLNEVILIFFIWLLGFGGIAMLTVEHTKDDSIALENSIFYIVVGLVLTTGMILFRDFIIDHFRKDS